MSILIVSDLNLKAWNMKMTLTLLFSLLSVAALPQKGQFNSIRSKSPEGNPELNTEDYHSYKKGHVLVYLSNDDTCLYVDMKIPEIPDQNVILRSGLTLWLSCDGKHHRTDGIKYPTGSRRTGGSGRAVDSEGPGTDRFEQQGTEHASLEHVKSILLIGFGSETPVMVPSENTKDIRGRLWYDQIGDLYYRLTIPFSRLPSLFCDISKPESKLAIGIEFGSQGQGGGTSSGMRGGGSGMQGGRMGGGGGSGFGGRMGGHGGMGGRGGMRGSSYPGGRSGSGSYSQQQSVSFWIKNIKLATR